MKFNGSASSYGHTKLKKQVTMVKLFGISPEFESSSAS